MNKKVKFIRTYCHRAHKMCFPDFFSNDKSQIKLLLRRNGYPQELAKKTISTKFEQKKVI